MIKNYKLFKESLMDHLKGPTLEEVENTLKQNYINGKIDIKKYYREAKKHGVSGPTLSDVFKEIGYNKSFASAYDLIYYEIDNLKMKSLIYKKQLLNDKNEIIVDYNKIENKIEIDLTDLFDLVSEIFDLRYTESESIAINILDDILKINKDTKVIFLDYSDQI